ncbi:MAG: DJ-1/PfpI family protein [Alphaproteobacteria bacterium]
MALTVGILIFDGAEELDFTGPYEIFTMSNEVRSLTKTDAPEFEVCLISRDEMPVICAKGMQVSPHCGLHARDGWDVILIPGGAGTRKLVEDRALLHWVADTAETCIWVTSVCTGALVLAAAGVTQGRRVTTHWAFTEELRKRNEAAEVLEGVRYVRDGNLVTAAGVSAGIDMALWLLGEIASPEHARAVQRAVEYDPQPPYQEPA